MQVRRRIRYKYLVFLSREWEKWFVKTPLNSILDCVCSVRMRAEGNFGTTKDAAYREMYYLLPAEKSMLKRTLITI